MVRQNFDLKLVSDISQSLFYPSRCSGNEPALLRGGNRANSFGLKSIAPWCVPHQLQIAFKKLTLIE